MYDKKNFPKKDSDKSVLERTKEEFPHYFILLLLRQRKPEKCFIRKKRIYSRLFCMNKQGEPLCHGLKMSVRLLKIKKEKINATHIIFLNCDFFLNMTQDKLYLKQFC